MSKTELKGAALLAPLPVVMVSAGDFDNANIIAVCLTGIVCSAPPRVYISVRRDRYSYGLLKKSGEFVINFTSESLLPACDYCGIRSGREIDKFSGNEVYQRARFAYVCRDDKRESDKFRSAKFST